MHPSRSTCRRANIFGWSKQWVALIGLEPAAYGSHSLRRTKVSHALSQDGKPQSLPAAAWPYQAGEHRSLLGVELDDALALSERLEI